jgi:hypothetical protein
MHSLLAGAAAAALGLATFAGRLEPNGGNRQPSIDRAATARAPVERPRRTVDADESPRGGRTIRVTAGGDLQGAIDAAKPGDTIALEQGATYRGPFRLPRKEGAGWIVIGPRTERGLPPAGRRVDPSHAKAMAKLVASSGDAIVDADPGAHHYKLIGLEIAPADGEFVRALVQIGSKESTADNVPHHFVIDRCYLHGDPRKGSRRGVALNSADTAVMNSYLSDLKEAGADSQAIAGWNGPGPFRIANNYLEAAGENVMFGGADPTIADLVPSDIEVTGNFLTKPLRWKQDDSSFDGTAWTIKNLFELKNARRVLVDGNLFEHNWPQAQNGFAILLTPRNQDGGAPWSVVEDVSFVNNVVRHVAAGMNMLGRDDIHRSQQMRRVAISNNVFLDVGGRWGKGRLFQLLDGIRDVTIDHNTALQSDAILWAGDSAPHIGFVFENNIVMHNAYGMLAGNTAVGIPTIERYLPGASVRKNVIVGGKAESYPPDNFFPSSVDQVGFAGHRAGNVRLSPSSRYARAGTDRRDVGADMDALRQLIAAPEGARGF